MPTGNLGSTSAMLRASLSVGITTLTVALPVNCLSGYAQGVTTSQTVTSTNLFCRFAHMTIPTLSSMCVKQLSEEHCTGTRKPLLHTKSWQASLASEIDVRAPRAGFMSRDFPRNALRVVERLL